MKANFKNILMIFLGIEVGITLFFFLSTSPVLSAWIPGATQSRPLPAEGLVTTSLPTTNNLLPEATDPPPTNEPTTLPVSFPALVSHVLSPESVTEPPPNPAILARSFPETFAQTPPIWLYTGVPALNEVALFRHAFEITEPTVINELQIFADTRYEVWLDGEWIGRGPARFSCSLREYDVYPLETLAPGPHLLAVLVQWAPNSRRSESNTPLLQARIQNYTANGPQTLVQTDSSWRAYAATAWQQDAGLVHTWELIGPMELLDLRYLPPNWMEPDFVDFLWTDAVQTVPFGSVSGHRDQASRICSWRGFYSSFVPEYQPRTISLLASTPITPTIYEVGLISPNRIMIEPETSTNRYDYGFNVSALAVFSVEVLALSTSAKITDTIQLDQQPLSWLPAGDNRPNVYVGLSVVQPGLHTLSNKNVKVFPLFAVFTDGIQVEAAPVHQGSHIGHRLLLAEPIPNESVLLNLGGKGINLRLDQTPSYLVLELPRITHGRLAATILGPAGTVVDIGWDEKLYNGVRPLPFPGTLHPQWSQVDSWVLDGNSREMTTIDTRTGKYILIAVWGDGPVEFQNLRVLEEHYPITHQGTFTTSNELLNKMWQVGVDTAQLNMSDAYADPWRERGQWWGDAYIVDRTNRVAFGEMELLRRGLQYMADGFKKGYPVALAPNGQGNHMLDYGMLWVQSLEAYATLNQDLPFVEEMFPTLQAFLSYLGKNTLSNGLLNVRRAPWGLSTYLDTNATFGRWGQSAAVNAMYYGTLQSAANIADLVADPVTAENWRVKAEKVKEQINAQLYLPDEGRYVATILSGRVYAPDPYAQAWPLAYGVVPESEIPRVTASLLAMLSDDPASPNVDVYGMNWVLEALGRSGYINEALGVAERYFGYILHSGATTWWESFITPTSYFSAASHGWGSSPTWFLSTYVLGGQWTGPDSWIVRPALEGVTSASGTIPMGEGSIYVSWETQSCSAAEIEITAPPFTTGEVIIPFANVTNISLNGTVLLKGGSPLVGGVRVFSDRVYVALSAQGTYRFAVERLCP